MAWHAQRIVSQVMQPLAAVLPRGCCAVELARTDPQTAARSTGVDDHRGKHWLRRVCGVAAATAAAACCCWHRSATRSGERGHCRLASPAVQSAQGSAPPPNEVGQCAWLHSRGALNAQQGGLPALPVLKGMVKFTI